MRYDNRCEHGCELCDPEIAAEYDRRDSIQREAWAEDDEVMRQAAVIEAWTLPAPARERALAEILG